MTEIHGFELINETDIPEINSHVRLFRHIRTGAELLSVENDDENKTFSVNFKTPPEDSTGLPHILEHSVLCGSRKYPVKEPFVQLLKSSVKTFLNAMTMPDMTLYPTASQNLQDFYNLIDVYMDAVFYPNLTPEVLKQEGWHYEAENADAPLIYKGVVFNEMKAAYSSPDRLLSMKAQEILRPETPYAHSSGGDPTVIPQLTFEQFKKFHETYYHPSNARFAFYGDDPADERLRLVNEFIAEFDRLEIDTELPLAPRYNEPQTVRLGYDAGEADSEENKTLMNVSWLLNEITDEQTVLELDILSHILVGTSASPLRKALIDSGLGEGLTGSGYSSHMRETSFSAGLKGIKASDADNVEKLILDTLGKLADDGIDSAQIEASLNTIEFQLREMNTGSFPRGLALMFSALPTWSHGGDPIEAMSFADQLEAVKKKYAENPNLFAEMIGEYLLSNPHRVTVILEPDPTVGPAREQDERDRLDAYRANLNSDDVQKLIDEAEALRIAQETPDNPEDIAKIPALRLSDLEREVRTIPLEVMEDQGVTVLYHDLATSEIAYVDVAFDLKSLPQEYLPYLSLFSRSLTQLGTETQDFVQLSQRIGSKTGGVGVSPMVTTHTNGTDTVAKLVLRGKSTVPQFTDMLDIFKDVLMTTNFDNQERFLQLVLQDKVAYESYVGMGGQAFAASRVNAHFSEAGWIDEVTGGIEQLFFLRELVDKVQNDWKSVLTALVTMRNVIVNRATMLCNITLDADNFQTIHPQLREFIGVIPSHEVIPVSWAAPTLPDREALTAPAQVNFVSKGFNIYDAGYEKHGSHAVITRFINMDYLWLKIRVQGGAYGGSSSFDTHTGMFRFLSWRDPNLKGTLDNYDGAAQFLKNVQISDDDLEKLKISTIGAMDAYQLPDAKGRRSMNRYLTGYTDEMRQKYRDEVFGATVQDFHKLGEILDNAYQNGKIAVVCSPQAAKNANENDGLDLTITSVL